jgi:transposase-like protein
MWATGAFVSDLAKRKGTIKCPRCKAPMNEVLWIAPVQTDPGLIAYECPSCSYVTSVLTQVASSRRANSKTVASVVADAGAR